MFWYSFYEKGAVMADFCRRALAYMTRQPLTALQKKKQSELSEQLMRQLRRGAGCWSSTAWSAFSSPTTGTTPPSWLMSRPGRPMRSPAATHPAPSAPWTMSCCGS